MSDDNPYSEAQFKTLKYRPDFPERFASIEGAGQQLEQPSLDHCDRERYRHEPAPLVMIRAAEKEPLLTGIGQIIHRSFALGASSFMLTSSEAEALLKHGQRR